MFWTWAIGNYKVIVLFLIVAGIGGYIWYLRADVESKGAEITSLQSDVQTLKENVRKNESAVSSMREGLANFQSFVNKAFDSVKATQKKIQNQNLLLQGAIDNLAALAAAAKRIADAPTIPFFMDNVVSPVTSDPGGNPRVYRVLLPSGGR